MSDEKALLAAIWEHPHEDTPRLLYADWLQETGEATNVARAEFIRMQIERSRLDEFDDAERIVQIKLREEETWKLHAKAWKTGLSSELKNAPFRRGFAYSRSRSFGGDKFLKLTPDFFDDAPQWDVNLSKFARLFDKVFASPLLVRVDELFVSMSKCPHDPFEKLTNNDRLRNVSNLYIANFDKSTPESIAGFLNSSTPASVTNLGIWTLCPGGMEAVAASRTAARLTDLKFCFANDGVPAEPLLASFPKLRSLSVRTLNYNNGESLLRLVTSAPPNLAIRKLNLTYCGLTDKHAEQLAAWPGLTNVRWLNVDQNRLGEAGCLALARSPYVGNLKYLAVHAYWLEKLPKVKAELDARFGSAIHYE